eukprot:9263580-Pyramimonas_sp.AAC.1
MLSFPLLTPVCWPIRFSVPQPSSFAGAANSASPPTKKVRCVVVRGLCLVCCVWCVCGWVYENGLSAIETERD